MLKILNEYKWDSKYPKYWAFIWLLTCEERSFNNFLYDMKHGAYNIDSDFIWAYQVLNRYLVKGGVKW